MRHVRQQDLCIAPQGKGNGFALQICDNTKSELRWFHKSSKSALVGRLWVCRLLCLFVLLSFLNSVILESLCKTAGVACFTFTRMKNVAVSCKLVQQNQRVFRGGTFVC